MAKRSVNLGGQEHMAEEVKFQPDAESGGEQWTTYALADGTVLKIKPVVSDVFRLEGMWAPNGDPLYSVNASLIIASNSPEQLRKKKD